VINQIKNVVGVRIRVSGRDEYIEGTRDRSVTISGPKEDVAIAERLVRVKLHMFCQPHGCQAAAPMHPHCQGMKGRATVDRPEVELLWTRRKVGFVEVSI
jgi:KH domain